MSKRQTRHIAVPITLWENADLSPTEKMVIVDIESYCVNGETTIGAQALATSTGIPTKEVKQALVTLQEKGGISVKIGENGQKILTPYLYKERYISSSENTVKVGIAPSDVLSMPWDEIAGKWAEICVTLPKITRWSPQRKNKLRSALKQADLTVEDLYKVFRIIACTPFLSGESDKFKCSFEWLTSKSSNLEKVYTGFYSRSYQEKRCYESIMRGEEVTHQSPQEDDYYR